MENTSKLLKKSINRLGSNPNLTIMDNDYLANQTELEQEVTFCVIGASGDLSRKKTMPALFSLYYHNVLPFKFHIVGFGRKNLSDQSFREAAMENLSCRTGVVDKDECDRKMQQFLQHVHYVCGQYNSEEDFRNLHKFCCRLEQDDDAARLFYLAVPPSVFAFALKNIKLCATAENGWTRVIIEKPFGRDSESYEELRETISKYFEEDQVYRIDHYVGKEVVQNITTLRFGNYVFESLWNRKHVRRIDILFKENFGTEGRAGYFDSFGIIRDIMQNHLLQVLAYLTMERPKSFKADDISTEKTKLIGSIRQLKAEDFVTGQYDGYKAEEGVPEDSTTPTFAACVLHIDNDRWKNVPVLMIAGKGLDERLAEIRILFRKGLTESFLHKGDSIGNQIVIRIQPDESISLHILSKVPGLSTELRETCLDLTYRDKFEHESKDIADAYERLILDAIHGEKSLFIYDEQLEASWKLFTPALNELESEKSRPPLIYKFGDGIPSEVENLLWKHEAECGNCIEAEPALKDFHSNEFRNNL
ncbi:glucose-6-phosphate 1-dehydrogenase [Galdieria sulphuraria]|uniref:Glucose-6-phosphate 1-dehydrogenase n=1 Tax=Galdieria sulphuraria TaxID=130081 RepID=M2X737_GALSU|nr:glucose-6-phosphate 1-dehydrogenase [Galdieria sulphuraria]EME32315.1 glucose-6-phosphate 1-dehydrogenase [Galdieria sulphuraria]|eukprot:XP_005708835.1 glucose-6-phosphate 1-dehydrogenase [Galdieria sulphuraria]